MSAYVVSKRHIDAMVGLATECHEIHAPHWRRNGHWTGASAVDPTDIGQMLVDECVRSVSHRYPDDPEGELPGPVDAYYTRAYNYERGPRLTPVEGLKAISNYEYQSCEHPEWEDSEACAFCRALERSLIGQLPGYEEAPWGVD